MKRKASLPPTQSNGDELDPEKLGELIDPDELFAQMDGVSVEEYRQHRELRAHLVSRSKPYINSPPEEWPPLRFFWDLKRSSQRFAFDGQKQPEFDECYPDGLRLGYVDVAAFDLRLCHFNRRATHEIWKVGFVSKLAEMIVYLEEGRPITPVAVGVTPQNELYLMGGNHRYTALKFHGVERMPIYVVPGSEANVETLVAVDWCLVADKGAHKGEGDGS
jgi:hypothetical protein